MDERGPNQQYCLECIGCGGCGAVNHKTGQGQLVEVLRENAGKKYIVYERRYLQPADHPAVHLPPTTG